MAGTLTSIIRTLFVSEGAPDVIRSTDALGRAQTRLGNASAGNGRQFAAQSAGMGGLVATYAGAAATIFTLQAAFTALSTAAGAENIIKGTNALAANIGQSGPQILASIQSITQGQLTLAQAAENTNIALSAGFNTDQIEKLNRVAMGASQALGRDLTDSVTRLTKGTAKLEPELLDELGIFTRIDPAVQAYAKSMNISANSLTNFEKRQAFANAVIEEGLRKFSAIDVSAPSTQKSLNQLSVEVQQLATEFLQLVTGVLSPLISFFKGDIGNSLLLFGGILGLVFGKGIGLIKDWANTSLTNLSSFAGELSRISEQVRGNFTGMTASVTAFNATMASQGGLAGRESNLTSLYQAGGMSADDAAAKAAAMKGTGGANQLVGAGAKTARTDYIGARDRFSGIAAGRIPDLAQRTKDLDTFKAALTRLTASGRENTLIFQRTSQMVTTLTASINGASLSARVFAGAAGLAAGAARVASIAFTALNISLGLVMAVVTVAQLAGSLLGVDYLGKLRDKISGITSETENLRKGFLGLTAAAAGGGDAITRSLVAAGATDKDLEKTNDQLIEIRNNLTNVAEARLEIAAQRQLGPMAMVGASQNAASIANVIPNILAAAGLGKGIETVTQSMVAQQKVEDEGLLTRTKVIAAEDELLKRYKELNTLTPDDSERIKQLNIEIIQYKAVKDQLEKYGNALDLVVGITSRLAGVDTAIIGKLFSSQVNDNIGTTFASIKNGSGDIERAAAALTIFGLVLRPLSDGTFSFNGLTESLKEYISSSALLGSTLDSINTGFSTGSITVDEYSAKLNGAQQQLKVLQQTQGVTEQNQKALNDALAAVVSASTPQAAAVAAAKLKEIERAIADAADNIDNVKNQIKAATRELQNFKIASNLLSSVQSTFSGQTGEVDKAGMSGLVSLSGELAKNSAEQKVNQTAILASIIKQDNINQAIVASGRGQTELNGEQLLLQQAAIVAKKAVAGQLIQEYQETLKLLQAEKKRTIELQNQLDLLKQQGSINTMAATFKLAATNAQNVISSQERGIQLQQTNIDNLSAGNSLELQRIKNLNEVTNLETDIANIKGSGNAAQDAAALQAIKNQTKLNAAARELIEMDRDVSSTKAEIEDKKRANLELEKQIMINNYNMQKKAIEASGGGNAAATKAQIDALALQRTELQTQAKMMNTENIAKLALFDKETQLQRDKIETDKIRLQNDRAILVETQKLDKLRLDGQKSITAFENQALQDQLKGFQSFATSVNGMLDATRTFATAIAELLGYLPGGDRTAIDASVGKLPQNQVDNLGALQDTLTANSVLQAKIYNEQAAQLTAIGELELKNIDAQIEALTGQRTDLNDLRKAQRSGIVTQQLAAAEELAHRIKMIDLAQIQATKEGEASGSNTAAQLAQLKATLEQSLAELGYSMADLDFESNTLLQALLAVKDAIRSSVTQALVDLNASFFDTTNDIRTFGEKIQDAFYNIFKSIQETFFQKAIAEPIANFVTDAVSGLFGGSETKGADNAKVIDGALLTTTAQGAGENPILEVAKEGNGFFARIFDSIKNMFSGIFGQGGFMSNLIGGVFGQGGIFAGALRSLGGIGTSIFSSLGNIIVSILSSISGGLGGLFASGGPVHHMAQGGGVNSLRDRVPAMLEPGEFVLRKQAASAIGVPALQAMNAGGAAGGNVVVNIKNEGTPQDATASKPRFDGEKFVIDIITRDLSNNGPIRRSMRAGS